MYKNESYLASEKDNYTELSLNEIYKNSRAIKVYRDE